MALKQGGVQVDKSNLETFNAEKFVQDLLKEGSKRPCDETVQKFNENGKLPEFYDEQLYKKGQKFFTDNIFALLYGKFLGLLTVLSIPSIVRILIYTKMSGTALTAYKRYLSTVFHMVIWYQSEFTPDSKLWESVIEVKDKHNSVSKRCCNAGLGRINQKDMALTQFGFMGFALAFREKIGLHDAKDDDLRALVHVWRVIGYVMGIEDRFNICRDSVSETSEICRILADQIFRPAVERKDKDFIEMATHLSNGMWAMNPTLNAKIYLNLVHRLLQSSNNNQIEFLIELNFVEKILYHFLILVIWSLQFNVFRVYHNYTQYVSLWLMDVFPFLAYYKFGYSNSHVKVLQGKEN
ncbi:uncharacterized protein LOC123011968 [Tribolium madens]|uniref:uncharacterized protein LOC123011968 n=1 Tax=Tribolium madens TaxID=41895 RepID=UPI001CF748AA|nr:uncharacterized protein LOC123011968 [Tribolium madens]